MPFGFALINIVTTIKITDFNPADSDYTLHARLYVNKDSIMHCLSTLKVPHQNTNTYTDYFLVLERE